MSHWEKLSGYDHLDEAERARRVTAFERSMRTRRTVRSFSESPVPRAVIESAIRTAASAPSGSNVQPWSFVAVSDPDVKRRIRHTAEAEEAAFYGARAPEEWLRVLQPFGTAGDKPFLEQAPWLIVVFAQPYGRTDDGVSRRHYYVSESVGIATGFLLAALHQAGLATLTHTPTPMRFLAEILGRPPEEQPFVLVATGAPARDATVPEIVRKSFDEVATFIEAPVLAT
jgi:iodotyrosine deiodinase